MLRRLILAAALAAIPAADAQAAPLNWTPCDDGLECATAKVPLDYDQPKGTQISLAVIRLPAADPAHRIGTLFTNPGGPGNSGVQFVRDEARAVYTDAVRARFDIVGFDPRGVGASTPVRCGTGDAAAPVPRRLRGGAGVCTGPGRARPPLPRRLRRAARPPLDGQRRPRHGRAACRRRRPQADLHRPLVRLAPRCHVRQPVPAPGARDRARRHPRLVRVDDRARPVLAARRQPAGHERRAAATSWPRARPPGRTARSRTAIRRPSSTR